MTKRLKTSKNLLMNYSTPYMTTRINKATTFPELRGAIISALVEYEGSEDLYDVMRSFVTFLTAKDERYTQRADEILNMWNGFKHHHLQYNALQRAKKIN